MARGELSYSKVRAVTRVACPATEDYFLSIALQGTAHHVETLVRGYRRAQEVDELSREARQQAHRHLHYCYGQQIVVHVDAVTMAEASAGCCDLEDGPAIAAESARRLACDASVVRIVEDENGQPLDIGRRTRTIPPAIRRALASRDRGCRFPGCTHRRYVDGHHIEHWAAGGATKLANLVLLCRFHHRDRRNSAPRRGDPYVRGVGASSLVIRMLPLHLGLIAFGLCRTQDFRRGPRLSPKGTGA